MTYEEFEWHILRLVYEEGVDRLQPSFLAYALGLPHGTVVSYLERAITDQLLDMDVTEGGRLEYFIPGVDRDALPTPVWREDAPASDDAASAAEHEAPEADDAQPGAGAEASTVNASSAANDAGEDGANGTDGADGTDDHADGIPDGTDGSVSGGETGVGKVVPLYKHRPELPPTLRSYIRDHYGEDGHVTGGRSTALALVDPVEIESTPVPATRALVRRAPEPDALARVESSDEAFCDPSQTIFMRQIRVHGVHSEAFLREQVQRLFESFGYRAVTIGPDRLRFERGSVTFILALVPLFVLILPLFVYLFLYVMGRSTIHQEPLELDVQIRRHEQDSESYDIDLTFIGLHGVVLGAADQRVLNQEIDTLRDELKWALNAS